MDDLLRMFGWDMERRAIAIELQKRQHGVSTAGHARSRSAQVPQSGARGQRADAR
jgi:hypothetical protein